MKTKIVLLLLIISSKLYCQNSNEGYIVEYNKEIEVEFTNYEIPLKINKVDSQDKIDYSNIEGLLQSFFSATNKKWALDEYLDKNVKLVRDEEHFKAIKKLGKQNYVQIEHIYKFDYINHKMAYIKYAFINEKLPFPIIGMMTIENVKNRWYISNILNQGAIFSILSRTTPDFLLDFFNGKSKNIKYDELIQKSKNKLGIIDVGQLFKKIEKLHEEKSIYLKELTDQRLIIEKTEFRNAKENSIPTILKFKISQPFVYDNVQLYEYDKSEKNLTKLDKRFENYSKLPESLIIENDPVNLLIKLKISLDNEEYDLIMFQKNQKKYISIVENNNGLFSITTSNEFKKIKELLSIVKPSFLRSILSNQDLASQKFISGSDGGVNIDLIYDYVISNKKELSKYLNE